MSPTINTTNTRLRVLSIGVILLAALVVVVGVVPVPLVALDPGPTYNTLGEDQGNAVVSVTGLATYPTTGHLDMTTVRLSSGLRALDAFEAWLSSRKELVPRSAVFPPGKSDAQVQQENANDFNQSENDAEVAAFGYLGRPIKVTVGPLTPDAPAAGTLRQGDQIISVAGKEINSPAQVSQILKATRPGDQIPVSYKRGDGPEISGIVRLGARPDGQQGFLGITPEGRPFDPNQIVIKLGDVGGPSAGLMFALAVVDKLTPSDLAGGRFIAGTGEIYPTGLVGPIGGITLKMIAARDAGASIFLTPAANCSEASTRIPEGLQLVKVGSLSDAVDALTAIKQGRPAADCGVSH